MPTERRDTDSAACTHGCKPDAIVFGCPVHDWLTGGAPEPDGSSAASPSCPSCGSTDTIEHPRDGRWDCLSCKTNFRDPSAAQGRCKPYVCNFPDPFSFRWLARWTCPDCGSTYVRRRQRKERWWRNWWAEHGDWHLPWVPFAWLPRSWSRQEVARFPW